MFVAGFSARRSPFAVKVLTVMQGLKIFLTNKVFHQRLLNVSQVLCLNFFTDVARP